MPANLQGRNRKIKKLAHYTFRKNIPKNPLSAIQTHFLKLVVSNSREAGKNYTNVVISYADHAFSCDERPSYNARAAKEAWAHTLAFFENRLK